MSLIVDIGVATISLFNLLGLPAIVVGITLAITEGDGYGNERL